MPQGNPNLLIHLQTQWPMKAAQAALGINATHLFGPGDPGSGRAISRGIYIALSFSHQTIDFTSGVNEVLSGSNLSHNGVTLLHYSLLPCGTADVGRRRTKPIEMSAELRWSGTFGCHCCFICLKQQCI
jgi:hypothetical protein